MKRTYLKPQIDEVRLDNAISLQLESFPTLPEDEKPIGGGSAVRQQAAAPYSYEGW